MFNVKAGRGRPDLFSSAKTSSPIRARHPQMREALVQASLDPRVRSIGHLATAHVAASPVAVDLDVVVLHRDDGRYVLDVVAARRFRDLEDEGLLQIALRDLGLRALVVIAEDLRAEPRCGNCRLVWSHHGRPVPVDLRIRILQILIDDGPMRLGRLLESVRSDRDPSAAVMSLACLNLLELDLISAPLAPDTMVRSRT
jgi:hypothetical protein